MLFQLTEQPIEPDTCRQQLGNATAGGFVSFEGWVRRFNEGREVQSLYYEAYKALCIKEAQVILEEARSQFDILDTLAVHRTGTLGLGDLAVWVGVTAVHRKPAFEACEYIIDAIKHRLPIWKRETYTDGSSQWVNCQQCGVVS